MEKTPLQGSQCTVVPHTIASSSDIKAALQHGALRTNIATLPASDVVSLLTELQRSPLALSTVLLQCVSSEGRRRGLPSGAKPGASKPSGPRLDLKSPDFITSQAAVAHRLRLQTSKTGVALLGALKGGLLGPTSSGLATLQISVPLPLPHLAALSEGLQGSTTLRSLSLEGSGLRDRGLETIKEGLLANTTLRELNLAGCALTDASAFLLANVLRARAVRRDNEQFKVLLRQYPDSSLPNKLQKARFRERLSHLYRTFLETCPTFKVLDVSYNDLTDPGACALLKSVSQSAGMLWLSLRENRLTYASGTCSLQAMAANAGLQAIDLRGNGPHLGLLTVKSKALLAHQQGMAASLLREQDVEGHHCSWSGSGTGSLRSRRRAGKPASPREPSSAAMQDIGLLGTSVAGAKNDQEIFGLSLTKE